MAKFVKKTGSTNYYEVDGYRAAGVVPYFERNNNYYILINKELRGKKILYHFLGGKVDRLDKSIHETAVREANEECGFLINNFKNSLYREILFNKTKYIKITKSKYISYLINIEKNNTREWLNIPNMFNYIFKDKNNMLKHTESLKLEWVKLSEIEKNSSKLSYLGKIIILKLKQRLDINEENENLVID